MDISSLLERPKSAASSGHASNSSKISSNSRANDSTVNSARPSMATTSTTPAPLSAAPLDVPQQMPLPFPPMQMVHYPPNYTAVPPHHHPHYPPMTGYSSYPPTSIPDPRLPPPIQFSHASGLGNKRLAPPHPHPAEAPTKKKQSKWTADEDRSIIELRGNGMKWEDISKHLPGRSAISCRLRFQNYLERRSEWDEEKKNKLARLYERYRSTETPLLTRRPAN